LMMIAILSVRIGLVARRPKSPIWRELPSE
jgi:hypothetical protein